ncbi:MAG: electron transport complex subunit E [Candidatus Aminicenantes bacterium]|nr:electron transport complex subunit E [Candidatus Aminicenantes bacterium]
MKKGTPAFEFAKGLWNDNPVLVQLLGMCPTLAVTTTVVNGLAMALATSFVLIMSSLMVSSFRKWIPGSVRIASYIVIIASFVTLADRFLAAYFYDISKALGPFIPLIIVNCIILGRQEAFSSKNTVKMSLLDAMGMSLGFLIALVLLSSFREILGYGTWFGIKLMPAFFKPWVIMIMPPGAFFMLGIILGVSGVIKNRASKGVV